MIERKSRYTETDGRYSLQTWGAPLPTDFSEGKLSDRPEWLTTIIDAATIGGHISNIQQPPPDRLLWFSHTKDNQLIKFGGTNLEL